MPKKALAIIWTLFSGILFYFFLSSSNLILQSFVNIFLNCFLVLFLIVVSGSIGNYFLDKFHCEFSSLLEEFVYSVGVGFGIFSYLILSIGLAGWLYPHVVYGLLLLVFLLFYQRSKRFILQLKYIPNYFSGLLNHKLLWVWIIIFVIVFISFLVNLTPTLFYDNLVYHYGVPKYFIAGHKIQFIPFNMHANFPQAMEMIFTLGMIVNSPLTANLIHFSVGIMLMITAYLFCRKIFNSETATFALLFFAVTPGLMKAMAIPNVEIGFAWYNILALFSLMKWFADQNKKEFILSSIFAGLSIGIKYTGAVYSLGVFLLLILMEAIIRKELLKASLIKKIIVYAGLAAIIFSPWMIKNYSFTGNPVFPSFQKYFDPKAEEPNGEQALLIDANQPKLSINLFKELYVLTRTVSVDTLDNAEKSFGFGAFVGLQILILFPLIFFLGKRSRETNLLISFVALYLILWLGTFWIIRFLYPAIIVCCFLAGAACQSLTKNKSILNYLIRSVMVLVIFFNLGVFLEIFVKLRPVKFILEGMNEKQYLSRYLRSFPVMERANQKLSVSEKILCLGETRNFYLDVNNICPSVYDVNPLLEILKTANDTEKIREKLMEMEITHLLYDPEELKRLGRQYPYFSLGKEPDKEILLNAFLESCLPPVNESNGVYLFKIKRDE